MLLILVLPLHTTPGPSYSLHPPAPTPFSLFQSVPENFQETDVFHLSQNVDFGKKLGVSGPVTSRPQPNNVAFNEVDTGLDTQRFLERLYCHNISGSVRRQGPARGRYSVSVTTAPPPPPRRQPKAPAPPPQRPPKLGGVSLDSLLPSIFTGPPRGRGRSRSRSTVRRRRPKFIGPAKASDRQGSGDVRWGSVLSDVRPGQSEGFFLGINN